MSKRLQLSAIIAAVSLFMLSSLPQGANAGQPLEAGILRCGVASGWGFVFGSTKDLRCVFAPADGSPAEYYRGAIQKIGIDVGYTESGIILWAVLAPTVNLEPDGLKGTYVGVTAEASAGLGLGANVLLGGGNSIALQPISISGHQGLNVAAGIGAVVLK